MDNIYIYTDQNVLSRLSARMLNDGKNLHHRFIVDVVRQGKAKLLYSFVHLDEIEQIKIKKFIDEHIQLLDDLKAIYIQSQTNLLDYRPAKQIWHEYLCENMENQARGMDNLADIGERTGKKLAGLPIQESFEDLNAASKNALMNLLCEGEKLLGELELEDSTDAGRLFQKEYRKWCDNLKPRVAEMESLTIPDRMRLGPQAFRDWLRIKNVEDINISQDKVYPEQVFRDWLQAKNIDYDNISPDMVIPEIQSLYKVRCGMPFDIVQFAENTIESQIVHCYFLMNWVGYFPDDFTKIKVHSDRYRASFRDMAHTIFAIHSQYLITDDRALRKKAEACYSYLRLPVIVTTSEEFALKFKEAD